MAMTKHSTHAARQRGCPACTWEGMSPEERVEHAARSRRARLSPEKMARREEILAGQPRQPCDRCGSDDTTAYITDYAAGTFLWRCRRCSRAAREAWRAAQCAPAA